MDAAAVMSCLSCHATEQLRLACVEVEARPKNGAAVRVCVRAPSGETTTGPADSPVPVCVVTLECRACGKESALRLEQLGARVYARWFSPSDAP